MVADRVLYEKMLEEYREGGKVNFEIANALIKIKYGVNIAKLSPQQLEDVISILLKESIIDRNVIFIKYFKETFPLAYHKTFDTLHHNDSTLIDRLLSYEDPKFLTKKMLSFSGFGHMRLEEGLLVMSETSDRKSYDINPTILDSDEFIQYLSILKEKKDLPVREKFVVTGQHWISGEIFMEEQGKPKIVFIDSLGKGPWMLSLIKDFTRAFPDGTVYGNIFARQFASKGCSAFALDDVRHLFTIDKYLPDRYVEQHLPDRDNGLFKYLADNIVSSEDNVNFVKLPISFMRTMQSSLLFRSKKGNPGEPDKPAITDFYDETQLTKPLGNGKPIAKEFTDTLKQVDNFIDKHGHHTKQNTRLEEKLDKMRNNVLEYLLKTPVSEVKQAMHEFTLDKFKERMTTKEERRMFRTR